MESPGGCTLMRAGFGNMCREIMQDMQDSLRDME